MKARISALTGAVSRLGRRAAGDPGRTRAPAPEADLFLERANAGDVEGVVALYEPQAVLAFPSGQLVVGHDQIRKVCKAFLADRPVLSSAGQQEPVVSGGIALTTTLLPGVRPTGPGGEVIDQPSAPP